MRLGFMPVFVFWGAFLIPVVSFAGAPLLEKSPQFSDTIQDQRGRLHTVWVSQSASTSALYYQSKDASGRLLAGPLIVSESSTRLRRPQVAIDGRNTVHLLWQERAVGPAQDQASAQSGATTVRYAKLRVEPNGAVTSLPHPVTLNVDRTATHPSLAVDQAGWAYAVWEIEGLEVELAAIDPSGHVSQVRRIAREATKTDHALPTVGVDRRGNVHVVWSAQSGDKTQLVYKAFRGHGGQVLEKEKIVYTTKGAVDQAKVVTFDPQGAVKVSWVNSQGRRAGQGRLARLGAPVGGGSLLIRHGRSGAVSAVAVADQSLTAVTGPVWSVTGEAAISTKPRLNAPAVETESFLFNAIPVGTPLSAAGDETVSKLLMERLLRYATWSAAPPSVQETAATRLFPSELSARSTRFRFIAVALAAVFPSHAEQHAGSDQIDLFAFQPVSFSQGGDQIA